MKPVFRYEDGVWPNIAAISLTVLGWPAGIALLGQTSWLFNALGVLLVAQTLVWSAYFIHEFAHNAIFRTPQANERWGTVMSWINGSCYASFADMRRKHMRHHVERADVITFDSQAFLRAHPLVRRVVLALEWAYIPAVEFVMRGYVIAMPFMSEQKKSARLRVVGTAVLRIAALALLGWWSFKALVLYGVAFLVFITVLRFERPPAEQGEGSDAQHGGTHHAQAC